MERLSPAALADVVRSGIAALGDPEKAPTMQAYMKSPMPYRGVSAQPLSRLLRSTYAEHTLGSEVDWHRAVLTLWDDAEYREERYAATTLARHRDYTAYQQPHTLDLYRHLIVTGAWWDHVDEVATHLVRGLLERHPDAVRPQLVDWAEEDDLWLRRSAIICQVGRRDSVDRNLLLHAVDANLDDSLHGREFFIRKAVGWALRDHARTDPDWVRAVLVERGGRLSGLSRREASRHL